MAATLSLDVLEDDVAGSLVRVVAAANKRAREFNIDVPQALFTIMQLSNRGPCWRINYGAKLSAYFTDTRTYRK